MLSFNLNSKKSAEDLIKLCEKYRDDVEVEVIHGKNKMQSFEEELEKIKKC